MLVTIAVAALVSISLMYLCVRLLPAKPVRYVTYRIIPPAAYAADLEPTMKLIVGLLKQKPTKFFNHSVAIGFEVIVSDDSGISFLVFGPLELISSLKQSLIAASPRLRLVKIKDGLGYLMPSRVITYAQVWRPRSANEAIEPGLVDTLLISLGGLKSKEIAGWQLIISARKHRFVTSALRLISGVVWHLSKAVLIVLSDLISDQASARQRAYNRAVKMKNHHLKPNDRIKACTRLLLSAPTQKRVDRLRVSASAALSSHGLKSTRTFQSVVADFIKRQPSHGYSINPDDLCRLYNLPAPGGKWEEKAELGYSSRLGAARQTSPELIIGMGEAGGRKVAVGLSKAEREKHCLIIGGTGMGKSTLLGYSFVQDALSGKGAALIDPHGDLSNLLLQYMPRQRMREVVYIDPADLRHPVGVNLLELPKAIGGDDLILAKEFVTEAIISIFRKIFSDDDSGGHRIEYILRNTIHTAFDIPGANLFTLHKLLTNDLFRSKVVSELTDNALRDFWYGEFNKAGSYQRVKMAAGVTAKLGRFQRSAAASRMLSPARSSIDFDDIISSNKLLICNLAKGNLGEDTASLLGMVILAKLQFAAWRRVRLNIAKRTPFMVYVDEFGLFNTPIFMQLISESRKFGVYLTLAEQTTSFQSDNEINSLLTNVGNVVCFRTAGEIDSQRILPLFSPYVLKSDLMNLEPYNFYLKASGEKAGRPLLANTLLLQGNGSLAAADRIINNSHQLYSYHT